MLSIDIYGKLLALSSVLVTNSIKESFALSGPHSMLVRYLIAKQFAAADFSR
jgi:hypothetical protein